MVRRADNQSRQRNMDEYSTRQGVRQILQQGQNREHTSVLCWKSDNHVTSNELLGMKGKYTAGRYKEVDTRFKIFKKSKWTDKCAALRKKVGNLEKNFLYYNINHILFRRVTKLKIKLFKNNHSQRESLFLGESFHHLNV